MAAEKDIPHIVWQRCGTEVRIKLRKSSKQPLQMLKEGMDQK
jgi:hypothetical protein